MTTPILIGAKETAQLLGIGRSLFLCLDRTGKVPMAISLGRRKLWRVDEIKAWTDAGCPSREKWQAIREAAKK